ncbi:hypothetical protein D3C72_1432690 [compost metagenome]
MRIGQDRAIGADDETRAFACRRHFLRNLAAEATHALLRHRKAKLLEELQHWVARIDLLAAIGRRGGVAVIIIVLVVADLARATHADIDHSRPRLRSDGGEIGQIDRWRHGARGLCHDGRHVLRIRAPAHVLHGGGANAAQHAGCEQGSHQLLGTQLERRGRHF